MSISLIGSADHQFVFISAISAPNGLKIALLKREGWECVSEQRKRSIVNGMQSGVQLRLRIEMNRFGQAMVMNGTIKDRLKADHLKNTIECIQQLTTTRQRCYIIWMLTLSCQFGIYSCWYCVWTGLVWLGKRSIGPTRMSQTTERPIHTERQIFVKISARNHHSTMKIGTQVVHNYPYGSAGFSLSQTVILLT